MLKYLFLIFISTTSWAQEQEQIKLVLADYFQGYQLADVRLIKRAFHADTRLLSTENGVLDRTEMNDWIKSLEARHASGDIRRGILKIHYIDGTGETASAKVTIKFPAFTFTDYLSLLKLNGRWVIVGKIYHFKETGE